MSAETTEIRGYRVKQIQVKGKYYYAHIDYIGRESRNIYDLYTHLCVATSVQQPNGRDKWIFHEIPFQDHENF